MLIFSIQKVREWLWSTCNIISGYFYITHQATVDVRWMMKKCFDWIRKGGGANYRKVSIHNSWMRLFGQSNLRTIVRDRLDLRASEFKPIEIPHRSWAELKSRTLLFACGCNQEERKILHDFPPTTTKSLLDRIVLNRGMIMISSAAWQHKQQWNP